MPKRTALTLAMLLAASHAALLVPMMSGPGPRATAPGAYLATLDGGAFSFGAAGDFGYNSAMRSVWSRMASAGLSFALSLGDLSYNQTSESNWCNYTESEVGDGHSILIAGNHDTRESPGGNINTFREHCNFGIDAPLTGDYGKEFYFDFPRTSPIARFILSGCGVTWRVDGQGKWTCAAGNAHYNFVANAIDGARDANIPWVIVGMHKNCISTGSKGCEIGEAFQDLLYSKKVDVVLQTHDHNYQRSKQLSCADDKVYRPACVADADTPFVKGQGTVLNIIGTGGRGLDRINETHPERPYFAAANSSSHGFTKFTVNATTLTAEFIRMNGGFSDSFLIASDGSPPPPPRFDFTLGLSPTSGTVSPGGSVVTSASATLVSGPTHDVQYSCSNVPAGTTCVVSPPACSPTCSASVTLTTSASTPLGTHAIAIAASEGSLSRTVTFSLVVSDAQVVTFQRGDGGGYSETDDAYIYNATPDGNFGSGVLVFVDAKDCVAAGTICRTLLKFPDFIGSGSGQVPPGSTIVTATLQLVIVNAGGLQRLYQVTEAWTETGARWNSFATPGKPGQKGPEISFSAPAGTIAVAIPGIVQNWVNGDANQGWLLWSTSSDGADYRSSESTAPPKLTVTYRPPQPTASIAAGGHDAHDHHSGDGVEGPGAATIDSDSHSDSSKGPHGVAVPSRSPTPSAARTLESWTREAFEAFPLAARSIE